MSGTLPLIHHIETKQKIKIHLRKSSVKPFVENTKLEFRSNNPAFIDRLYFFFIVYQIFAAYLKAELFYIDCNYLQGRIIIY